MKKYLLVAAATLAISSPSFAYLSTGQITTLALPVYGIYMTADASCLTGLVATVPLTKTPQSVNFAAGTAIGSGTLPATIGCVVIVAGKLPIERLVCRHLRHDLHEWRRPDLSRQQLQCRRVLYRPGGLRQTAVPTRFRGLRRSRPMRPPSA